MPVSVGSTSRHGTLTVLLGHHEHALLGAQAAVRVGAQDQVVAGFALKVSDPQGLLGDVGDVLNFHVGTTCI